MCQSAPVGGSDPIEPAQLVQHLWQQGQRPEFGKFLADSGDLSAMQMLAVILVDQRERWQSGERIEAAGWHALSLPSAA